MTLKTSDNKAVESVVGDAPSRVTVSIQKNAAGKRIRIAAIMLAEDKGASLVGQVLRVCGWARTVRKQGGGNFCFVELSDGSCCKSLQVVVDSAVEGFQTLLKCGAGCSFKFEGELLSSPAAEQPVELSVKDPQLHTFTLLGEAEGASYPLAKKQHSVEFLREIGHLRPRSNLIGAVTRVRSSLAMATHRFFQDRGFLYVCTPIITASDCEGGGEMFQVTTMLPTQGSAASDVPKQKTTDLVDYTADFFHKPAFLTVSGQLAVEAFSCSLCDVYTFGPTFRAEKSFTSRHLAEFWMIEPELAFADINVCVCRHTQTHTYMYRNILYKNIY
eukprot:GHVR01054860.1.p1 GENE.GHVR01054860.1~~GHVR01054860.1.p1  ORF type:complete len:330 (+),score=84.25 GHVR01054860.1:25-1014(+)